MRAFTQRDRFHRFSRWLLRRGSPVAQPYIEPSLIPPDDGCADIRRTPAAAKRLQLAIENSDAASRAVWALINGTAPAMLLPSALGAHGDRRPEGCMAVLVPSGELWPSDVAFFRPRDCCALLRARQGVWVASGMWLWVDGDLWNLVHVCRVSTAGGTGLYAAQVRPPDTS